MLWRDYAQEGLLPQQVWIFYSMLGRLAAAKGHFGELAAP